MGFDINIDVDLDEDSFRDAFAEVAEKAFQEWIEAEVGDGHLECDCGSQSFDVETWTNASGAMEGGAVCRECNERIELDIDTSEIDALRR